ncbi:uncharacterized protein AMSG_08812 [Thecamonas trahens ATCC 50062]|uniref:Uncharacterized protein n=1 Tax=Thecamonas trahens ATCC 50062 TaxID=461836 RepID=A0A0L0DLX4_THETB|nr:hypothetical protein AMSG_08812 [Thecamonas trahens ATCC 50062]KNC53317.1 hypothetical protein AMSG_08812 [Thecamonas trahens ATCC 50062]|eukprot:XP_013754577.1 hypothetical protein AMSG_08812 [Thecamonas trahens ATCC 50062]
MLSPSRLVTGVFVLALALAAAPVVFWPLGGGVPEPAAETLHGVLYGHGLLTVGEVNGTASGPYALLLHTMGKAMSVPALEMDKAMVYAAVRVAQMVVVTAALVAAVSSIVVLPLAGVVVVLFVTGVAFNDVILAAMTSLDEGALVLALGVLALAGFLTFDVKLYAACSVLAALLSPAYTVLLALQLLSMYIGLEPQRWHKMWATPRSTWLSPICFGALMVIGADTVATGATDKLAWFSWYGKLAFGYTVPAEAFVDGSQPTMTELLFSGNTACVSVLFLASIALLPYFGPRWCIPVPYLLWAAALSSWPSYAIGHAALVVFVAVLTVAISVTDMLWRVVLSRSSAAEASDGDSEGQGVFGAPPARRPPQLRKAKSFKRRKPRAAGSSSAGSFCGSREGAVRLILAVAGLAYVGTLLAGVLLSTSASAMAQNEFFATKLPRALAGASRSSRGDACATNIESPSWLLPATCKTPVVISLGEPLYPTYYAEVVRARAAPQPHMARMVLPFEVGSQYAKLWTTRSSAEAVALPEELAFDSFDEAAIAEMMAETSTSAAGVDPQFLVAPPSARMRIHTMGRGAAGGTGREVEEVERVLRLASPQRAAAALRDVQFLVLHDHAAPRTATPSLREALAYAALEGINTTAIVDTDADAVPSLELLRWHAALGAHLTTHYELVAQALAAAPAPMARKDEPGVVASQLWVAKQ